MHRTSPRLTLAALVALAAVAGSRAVAAADFIDLATVDRELPPSRARALASQAAPAHRLTGA